MCNAGPILPILSCPVLSQRLAKEDQDKIGHSLMSSSNMGMYLCMYASLSDTNKVDKPHSFHSSHLIPFLSFPSFHPFIHLFVIPSKIENIEIGNPKSRIYIHPPTYLPYPITHGSPSDSYSPFRPVTVIEKGAIDQFWMTYGISSWIMIPYSSQRNYTH